MNDIFDIILSISDAAVALQQYHDELASLPDEESQSLSEKCGKASELLSSVVDLFDELMP
ncbi:MAG: hypothetical protein D6698_17395 [Gammaproteobacteria bacterium]|nr:MAG: hypothetical protein D6698_17395 [Gammaproteobacteria bacterium]